MDEFDESGTGVCRHYLLVQGNERAPVGACRIREYESGVFKLKRFIVAKKFRKMGYGRLLLQRVLKDYEHSEIMLHTQLHAVDFYKKLGFVESGDPFLEGGAPHQEMRISGLRK